MSDRAIDPLIEAIITKGIEPILKQLQKDIGQSLSTEVVIIMDDIPGPRVIVSESEKDAADIYDGEARVKIRRTFKSDRYLFSIEAVYRRNISPKTGFSGFTAKGEIRIDKGDKLDVRLKNWTARYNIWEFYGS